MKLSLSKGLTKDEESELKQNFIQAQRLRKRLVEVLESKVESLQVSMRDEENYSKPAWSELQADKIGQTKSLLYAISLIK